MKALTFNFEHPFKGRAIIKLIGSANAFCKRLLLDSKENNLIEIPLNDFQSGKYEISLDWEVDHLFFAYRQTVEIDVQPDLIRATA